MSKKNDAKHKNKKTKLEQHERQGKKLLPPIARISNIKMVSWIHDRLAEYLWVILLLTNSNRHEAIQILKDVSKLGLRPEDEDVDYVSYPGSHTNLTELSTGKLDNVFSIITNGNAAKLALRPLLLLQSLPQKEYWSKAIGSEPNPEEDWPKLAKAVLEAIPHQHQIATDCQWFQSLCLLDSDKFHMPESMAQAYRRYPDGSELSSGLMRASALSLGNMYQNIDQTWTNNFWNECMNETYCSPFESHQFEDDEASENEPTEKVDIPEEESIKYTDYPTILYDALIQHFHDTKSTTNIDEKHEMVFGFALYSLSIIKELYRLEARQTIISRMGLRTILECYITLAYMAKSDDPTIWMKYRQYGTGQAKLALLKLQELGFPCRVVSEKALNIIANEDADRRPKNRSN